MLRAADTLVLDAAIERLQTARQLVDVQFAVRTAARRSLGADGATFVLREADQCFYADEDALSPLWKGQRFPLTDCISGWAMLHNRAAIVPDISEDERVPLAAYRPTFVRSLAMVPVGQEQPVAAIGVYWAHEHEASVEEMRRLLMLADAAAAAIARVGLDDAPFTPGPLASPGSQRFDA